MSKSWIPWEIKIFFLFSVLLYRKNNTFSGKYLFNITYTSSHDKYFSFSQCVVSRPPRIKKAIAFFLFIYIYMWKSKTINHNHKYMLTLDVRYINFFIVVVIVVVDVFGWMERVYVFYIEKACRQRLEESPSIVEKKKFSISRFNFFPLLASTSFSSFPSSLTCFFSPFASFHLFLLFSIFFLKLDVLKVYCNIFMKWLIWCEGRECKPQHLLPS